LTDQQNLSVEETAVTLFLLPNLGRVISIKKLTNCGPSMQKDFPIQRGCSEPMQSILSTMLCYKVVLNGYLTINSKTVGIR
jgi:hypothetical protein